MPFATIDSLPVRQLFDGISGRYAHTERITVGDVNLVAGANVPVHQHPHDQMTFVLAGEIEFAIADETRILGPGQCAIVPGNTPHRVRAIKASRVIDIFSPAREDYR